MSKTYTATCITCNWLPLAVNVNYAQAKRAMRNHARAAQGQGRHHVSMKPV